jgi:ADP-heptose:LPS heptosyltransferase
MSRGGPVEPRPTLVVLRALGLGDFLTGIPALRALRAGFPVHRRILAAPAMFAPLVASLDLADSVSATHGLQALDPALAGADVAVDLHGRGPGSQPLLLALSPRRLISFRHPALPATAGGPCWRPDEHEVARWCRLLRESGVPADASQLDVPVPAVEVPAWARGATVVHPGAASGSRRWPAERFAAVASHELRAGRTVAVTGGPDELQLCHHVAHLAGVDRHQVLAGRTDLAQLLGIVGAAARVVSGDTGVAHVATALRTPSVVLFGPVPPAEWGPPPERPWHVALWAGRRGDPHGDTVDAGLLAITADEVCAVLDRLPAAGLA